MNYILSFDASTTTIAFAHLSVDQKVVKLLACDHYNPSKKLDLFPKLAKVQDFVKDVLKSTSCQETAIEDIILHMARFSTAKTISTLAILNRTVGLTIFNETGVAPELLNVMKIRHAIKLNKELPKKEEIPSLVEKYIDVNFPYVINKKGKQAIESQDRADAIVVGLASFKIKNLI
jgi:Holliday junction resolvasome RuvABC endonuclease subunit